LYREIPVLSFREKVISKDIRKYVFLKTCPNYNIHIGMIFFRVIKYLKYMLLSENGRGHGIHSPFVFDLVSRVFRNKIDSGVVSSIEKIRKKLLSDQRSIHVTDFGAGSVKLKTKFRKVNEIVRFSSVTVKYGKLLSNMAAEFGEPYIIEMGTSFGISTLYLTATCSGLKVKTIEGSSSVSEIAIENFKDTGRKNIEVITGSFDVVLPEILKRNSMPGLVFIDGNHRKEPVMKYFTEIAEYSGSRTVIIIDDINYSEEMEEAWNEIKQFEKVSVTVDIFRMGMVFFREGISHKNYIIRY
jgi:predicted O-methyltransferase YrrM